MVRVPGLRIKGSRMVKGSEAYGSGLNQETEKKHEGFMNRPRHNETHNRQGGYFFFPRLFLSAEKWSVRLLPL